MIEEIKSLFFALILSLLALWAAKRAGFFTYERKPSFRLPLLYLIGAFGSYIASVVIILPLFYLILAYVNGLPFGQFAHLSAYFAKKTITILQLISMLMIVGSVFLYFFLIKKEVRNKILFGDEARKIWRNIGLGILTLAIAYPIVLFVNIIISWVVKSLFGPVTVEQLAVKELKNLVHMPLYFGLFALFVCILVPFIEELLFRGFLQTYLRNYLGVGGSIILTSAIFAFAHFSKEQGVGNIELLGTLFVLALFLGFLYERQRNLFASFGLHMAFNTSSIIAIAMGN